MDLINRLLFFFVIIGTSLNFHAIAKNIASFDFHLLAIEECLLPEDHPLYESLKDLFQDPKMFKSRKFLLQAGFHVSKRMHRDLMVASHPALKGYLIKKFRDNISLKDQLENYCQRINGARVLKEFIQLNQLQQIVVPQKWLYLLPSHFADATTGENAYLLIVEKMPIDTAKKKIARKYQVIDRQTLKELCLVLYFFRGLDSTLLNMPFTSQNQIAFIDTEKWAEERHVPFLHQVMPYLNRKSQRSVLEVFDRLSQKH